MKKMLLSLQLDRDKLLCSHGEVFLGFLLGIAVGFVISLIS